MKQHLPNVNEWPNFPLKSYGAFYGKRLLDARNWLPLCCMRIERRLQSLLDLFSVVLLCH